jgi:hypothetical protein
MLGRQRLVAPDKSYYQIQLTIGRFVCPKCHLVFRAVISKERIKVPPDLILSPESPALEIMRESPKPSVREIIREKEVIVKIRCQYCNNVYDETLDKCPYCGGKR